MAHFSYMPRIVASFMAIWAIHGMFEAIADMFSSSLGIWPR